MYSLVSSQFLFIDLFMKTRYVCDYQLMLMDPRDYASCPIYHRAEHKARH